MSKRPVLEMQYPADIDWNNWFEHWDNINDYFGREKNESCRCPGS